MKIGIVTQPLLNNYGGVLQNYALQAVLRQLGHTPITIDYMPNIPLKVYRKRVLKRLWYNLFHSKKRPEVKRFLYARHPYFEAFVRKNIALTDVIYSYTPQLVADYGLEAVVVGSDQVWRPCYNQYVLTSMFLDFVKEQGVKRVAYAASFGVDGWEFNAKQSKRCRKHAQKLDGVSVRENSGIALCREELNIDAVEVLDPTLLLSAEHYSALCADVERPQERYIGAYILDSTPEKVALVEEEAKRRGVACKIYGAHDNLELSVEEWLAMFKNAESVITDSFHGCVFSIIFRKEFVALLNSGRGESRFKSLLGKFDLSHRIVTDPKQGVIPSEPIDWSAVEKVLAQWQEHSLNYIESNLR